MMAMHSFTISLLGSRIAVDGDPEIISADEFAQLQSVWSHARTDQSATARVFLTDADGPVAESYQGFVRVTDPAQRATMLSDVVVRTAVAALLPDADRDQRLHETPTELGIFAGGIAVDDRGLLVLPSPGLVGARGAATLRALASRFTLLSDAAVAVDRDARSIAGATKPVTTYDSDLVASRRDLPLSALGLRHTAEPVMLAATVSLEPVTDGESGLESIPIPVATARLARAVPLFPALPRPIQDVAQVLALTGGAVRVRYRDAAELPDLLDEVLATGADSPLVIPVDVTAADGTVPQPGDIRRTPMVDGITDGETMALLLQDRTPVAVSGLGPHLWDLTRDWIGLDALTEQVTERLGSPGDARPRDLVDQAVTELAEQKVLTRL
jgi:hypothetical protein